jgi:hypothetical protein
MVVATGGPADSTVGGPPSTSSSALVVATAGPAVSTPKGPAINVLQQMVVVASIYCQHLPGEHHGKHYCYGAHYKQDIS